MRAVQIVEPGGPDALILRELETLPTRPGHLIVKTEWAGVNFIDVYQRSGRYPLELPETLGFEGYGVVTNVGEGVTGFSEGDSVAWAWAQGSYADFVSVPADKAYPVPDGIDGDIACAAMMQGITAQYLVTSVYPASAGDTALVHAAAGGVGLLLTQMLVARGVIVIGTVSSAAKEEAARHAGAHHIIRYDDGDFAPQVAEITKGKKCEVVYDSVGVNTFEGSLQCLAPRGTLALFGAASGPVPLFDLQRLSALGSIYITRPTIAHFLKTPEESTWRSREVFSAILDGSLVISVGGIYELGKVSQAHRDIESRATSGKLLLKI